MALTAHAVKQFAAVTSNGKTTVIEGTANGTIVVRDGKTYAKLDGSDAVTPISASVKVENGERVVVTVKNHQATVMGNTTKPALTGIRQDEDGINLILEGVVTFDDLSGVSGNKTVIHGGLIKTETIEVDSINLKGAITFEHLAGDVTNNGVTTTGLATTMGYVRNTVIGDGVIQAPKIMANRFTINPKDETDYSGSFTIYGNYRSYSYGAGAYVTSPKKVFEISYYGYNESNQYVVVESPIGSSITIGNQEDVGGSINFIGNINFSGATVTGLNTTATFA